MLFVGGIRGKISKDKVEYFFSQFGSVKSVKLKTKMTKDGRLVCVGHCIVTMESENDRQKVLSKKDLKMEGRRIFCKKYMTGSELEYFHRDFNSRRIIITGLFDWITDEKLTRAFSKFGPIDNGYILKNANDKSSKCSGFVLFHNPKSTEQAINAFISFGGLKFVEVNYFNKKVSNVNSDDSECLNLTQILKNQLLRIFSKEIDPRENPQNKFEPKELSLPHQDYKLVNKLILRFFKREHIQQLLYISKNRLIYQNESRNKIEPYFRQPMIKLSSSKNPKMAKKCLEENWNDILSYLKLNSDIILLIELLIGEIESYLFTKNYTHKIHEIVPTTSTYHNLFPRETNHQKPNLRFKQLLSQSLEELPGFKRTRR